MGYIFDVLFLIDALLTFFAAVLTEDYNIIDDKKEIACMYIKGWFFVDILSCIPYGAVGKPILDYIKLINEDRKPPLLRKECSIHDYFNICKLSITMNL